ncbi:MAG: hypothetical protein J0I19_02060 [Alphaproteobacteria bacterium]|nr:hypothetical protein [Alphaproteobacteria bacterium]
MKLTLYIGHERGKIRSTFSGNLTFRILHFVAGFVRRGKYPLLLAIFLLQRAATWLSPERVLIIAGHVP